MYTIDLFVSSAPRDNPGHLDYAEKMDVILKYVGIRTKDEYRRIVGVPKARADFPSFSSASGAERSSTSKVATSVLGGNAILKKRNN
jgi:hypothetical protein